MPKKITITFLAFALIAVLVFLAGMAAAPAAVSLPEAITAQTPCPVAGCTQQDAGCHAAAVAPQPDGSFNMVCPRITDCSSEQCHAWDRISSTRGKPSDASMNLWIIAPVVIVLGLIALVKKL